MDLITQAVLGGAVGQALGYKKLGRQAIAWGTIGGIIPDLDVIAKFGGPFLELTHHRGITHSVWFGLTAGFILGYLLWHFYKGSLNTWVAVMIGSILTHPLLDVFTVYGTQLLAPLSFYRFTIPAMPIVDPLYTVPLALAMGCGYIKSWAWRSVVRAAWIALAFTTAYVGLGYWQNCQAYNFATHQLRTEGVHPSQVEVFPTLFQIFLRRVVVRVPHSTGEQIRIGFVSTWAPHPIKWHIHNQEFSTLFNAIKHSQVGQWFQWFASESTVIYADREAICIRDLRFGFPGETVGGLWELRVVPGNGSSSKVTFCRLPIKVTWKDIKALWMAGFGQGESHSSLHSLKDVLKKDKIL